MSTFSTLYDNGPYGYMGIGPMPAKPITFTLTATDGDNFYCGTATYWGVCAYDPADKTKYAILKSNPLHEVYHDESYLLVCGDGRIGIPKTVSVDIPASSGSWNFYGGLTSVVGCALCIITYNGTGEDITLTSGNSPCNSDYAAISSNQQSWFSYEIKTLRFANSIDSCPIFADRSTNDANGDQIDTTYLKSANATGVKKITTSLPPVSTTVSELDFFTSGRVQCDSSDMGLLAPYPGQADSGKILQATWTGSPSIGSAIWVDKPTGVPASVVADKGKVLTVNNQGAAEWQKREYYFAGTGITETTDLDTGNITFDWAYTVGRHLVVNSHDQLCVSMPGALDDASSTADNLFYPVTNGEFSGSFVLMTRKNANETYDIGLRYTSSGTSSTFSFVGTETVVANDNTITVNPAVYMGETVTYSGNKFGTTAFNPATHKAIYYSGLAMIGHISDTKIAIFKDADNIVKVAFTSMEGKLW